MTDRVKGCGNSHYCSGSYMPDEKPRTLRQQVVVEYELTGTTSDPVLNEIIAQVGREWRR